MPSVMASAVTWLLCALGWMSCEVYAHSLPAPQARAADSNPFRFVIMDDGGIDCQQAPGEKSSPTPWGISGWLAILAGNN